MPRAPRRLSPPSAEQIQRLNDIGWLESGEVILSEMALLPDDAASTPVARQMLLIHVLNYQGEYDTAVRVALRAIRSAPRSHEVGASLRQLLAHSLSRLGHLERAKRILSRILDRSATLELSPKRILAVRDELGRVARRLGELAKARQCHEQSLAGVTPGSLSWCAMVCNLAHTELRAGELERARKLLESVDEHIESLPPGRIMFVQDASWLSYWIEMGDKRESQRQLQDLRAHTARQMGPRDRLLIRNYEAEVLLLAGRNEEAARAFESTLEDALAAVGHADLVSSLARGLAESLHALGDHERAEDRASLAVRAGHRVDRLEELIGLRLQGQCAWAMGRHQHAIETFARAQALHVGLEFTRERSTLAAKLQALGITELGSPDRTSTAAPNTATRAGRPGPGIEVIQLALADGRQFLTTDHELHRQLVRAANSDLPVLIEGETGTGKELVAMLLHELRTTATGPFVVVDCSALPETLVEAELFGVARGAYTGATEARAGVVANAEGGTLFLDELPELSLVAQAKLLRLLQEGTYRRIGETTTRKLRARFIAASNRPLAELLAERKLRPDLFHRLNGHRIQLRPLRERQDEIAALARSIVEHMGIGGIDDDAIGLLERAPWSGNVRELEMLLRVLGSGVGRDQRLDAERVRRAVPAALESYPAGGLRESRLAAERLRLGQLLQTHGGNVTAAARALGISRQAFYKALRRTGGAPREDTGQG
jgi:transcriptional regulator of acetoin/glycerol metabolism